MKYLFKPLWIVFLYFVGILFIISKNILFTIVFIILFLWNFNFKFYTKIHEELFDSFYVSTSRYGEYEYWRYLTLKDFVYNKKCFTYSNTSV